MIRTTLRIDILRNFIVLILLVTVLLLGLQYYSSTKLATEAVNKNFRQTSNNIVKYIKHSETDTKETLEVLSLNSYFQNKLNKKICSIFLDDFVHIMLMASRIKGIYIGYKNNDFYEVINLKYNPSLIKNYNASKESQFAVITVLNKQQSIKFLDKKLKILNRYPLKTNFFASTRPWYKKAIKTTKVIRTDLYKFESTKANGVTFAKHIRNSDAVIGIDYTLNELNNFLKEQNFNEKSYIVLYEDSGKRIATSRKISDQSWEALMKIFQTHPNNNTQVFTHNKIKYFTYHTITKTKLKMGKTMHIGVLIPKDSLLDSYIEKIIHSLYAAFAFVILTIPLIFYSTSKIIKPIRALMIENEKVVQRKFDEVIQVDTNIMELHEFSVSFVIF